MPSMMVRTVELVGVSDEVVEASEDLAVQVAEQANPGAQGDRGLSGRAARHAVADQ
jgi:hypothetical protein